MYGYTMHFPAPIDAYLAMHKAILEVLDEEGGAEGLLLHVAYPTDQGFDLTEVWESKEQANDWFANNVAPALPEGITPRRTFRELYNVITP
jgi:hypothetical protein